MYTVDPQASCLVFQFQKGMQHCNVYILLELIITWIKHALDCLHTPAVTSSPWKSNVAVPTCTSTTVTVTKLQTGPDNYVMQYYSATAPIRFNPIKGDSFLLDALISVLQVLVDQDVMCCEKKQKVIHIFFDIGSENRCLKLKPGHPDNMWQYNIYNPHSL